MDPAPKDGLTEIAARLLNGGRSGALATVSVKHDGFPFASQTSYAVMMLSTSSQATAQPKPLGVPVFLFSDLSVHSKNLRKNSKATLLVQAGAQMQQSRVSLMGTIDRLPDAMVDDAREVYLADHPQSAQWMSFGDFRFYAMSIVDCYVVAGFGKAGWVRPAG